ncbi:MAG: AAA family ATPase [Methanoregulaceae archaeon]|jgi:cytidylate kinase|nr:AAA family ATPase [Methanoregulaceae archaeon]
MRITVSGLPGSGTTSLARYLAEILQTDLISAGEVFRQMAREHGMELAEFGRLAESDPSFDRLIDDRQKDIALAHENIIVEGRLSGWFVPQADLKIWLYATPECRVTRIQTRDTIEDLEAAAQMTRERESCEAVRYKTYYEIDIADISPYHIVLNSERFSVEELGSIVCSAIGVIRQRT